MIILGTARPDCQHKDKNSMFGCREQAKFVMFIRGPKGEYENHRFYFCRGHVAAPYHEMLLPLARQFHTKECPVKAYVQDLDLLQQKMEKMKKLGMMKPDGTLVAIPSKGQFDCFNPHCPLYGTKHKH